MHKYDILYTMNQNIFNRIQKWLKQLFGISLERQSQRELMLAQRTLQDEKWRFRGLFEQTNDAVFLMGLDGSLLEANEQASQFLGYDVEEIVKRPFTDFLKSEERSNGEQALNKLLAGDALSVYERAFLHKDGTYRIGEINAALILDANREPSHVQSVVRDVTARKLIENDLQEQENFAKAILESTADGILAVDPTKKTILVNTRFVELWQLPPDLVKIENDEKILTFIAKQLKHTEQFLERVESLSNSSEESKATLYLQDGRVMRFHSFPLHLLEENGRVWRFRDITEREETLNALRDSEERLASALKGADLGLWDMHIPTGFTLFNTRWAEMLGYTVAELTPHEKTWRELVHPEDINDVLTVLSAYLLGETQDFKIRHRLRTKSGEWKWVLSAGRVVERDADGIPVRVVGIHQDITEQHNNQIKLKESLAEKELLLKEVHHRVKNNLQVVSSLLDWQASLIEDEAIRQNFTESQSRIHSMSLVHETLYQSQDLGKVDINAYIISLVGYLQNLLPLQNSIKITMDVKDVHLDINTAVPCGQLINELLTNAYKHAFPNQFTGEINICFHQKDESFLLTVADNGIGFPSVELFEQAETLGIMLIKTLTQQLSGDIQFKSDSRGTTYKIQFKELAY